MLLNSCIGFTALVALAGGDISSDRALAIALHALRGHRVIPHEYNDRKVEGPMTFEAFIKRFRSMDGNDVFASHLRHRRFWFVKMRARATPEERARGIFGGGGGYWAFVEAHTGAVLYDVLWK